jgi:predicted porin
MKNFFITRITLLLTMLTLTQFAFSQKQNFYSSLAFGYSRAQDAIPSIIVKDVEQMAFHIRAGFGYQFTKNLAVELSYATQTSPLSATGQSAANSLTTKVNSLYSSAGLHLVGLLPLNKTNQLFLSAGYGTLILKSTITQNGSEEKFSITNGGILLAAGYHRSLSNRVGLQIRFDFSNSYGNEKAWKGDLGCLSIGADYKLTQWK